MKRLNEQFPGIKNRKMKIKLINNIIRLFFFKMKKASW